MAVEKIRVRNWRDVKAEAERRGLTDPAQVMGDRLSLGILLEYAYRGEAALGGNCRNDREAGCALCATFTEAESLLGDDAPERNWWTPTLRERLSRHLRRRK